MNDITSRENARYEALLADRLINSETVFNVQLRPDVIEHLREGTCGASHREPCFYSEWILEAVWRAVNGAES